MKHKRLLSLIMAAAMIVGSAATLPQEAFDEIATASVSADNETSGKCGDYVRWSLKDGVLTISGKGKMSDYSYFARPFAGKGIKSVVVESGVTSIGEFAFHECASVTSVTLSDSVTSIGEFAFYDCLSLEKINIPSSVTNICSNAFKHCVRLSEISIPSSITSVGDYVFCGCSSLTEVNIPSSVTNIGINAFGQCTNLERVTIPKSVTSISAYAFSGTKWLENQQKKDPMVVVNGILIDARTCEGNVTVPSSAKSIGNGAFYGCTGVTGVTIPNSVKSIGWNAFYECQNLSSITIPSSVTSIGHNAFYFCTSLTSVTIPSGVKSIDKETFWRCTSLTSVTIPNSVTSIGNKAFSQCGNLTKVTIPNSVKSIGDEAFSNCSKLESITIPGSVESIGKSAFESCKGLTSVTIQKGVKSIGESAFLACSFTSLTIPDSVTSIGREAFYCCKSLTSVAIPGGVTNIDIKAFAVCSNLKSVTILNGVTSIGDYAFDDCASLTNLTIPSSVKSIGERAFWRCFSLTSVTIPDSVKNIGNEAFGLYYYIDSFQFGKVDGFTIKGYKGTAAEKYAKDNDFKFVEVVLPKAARLKGSGRFATAAAISSEGFESAETVVLTNGYKFADALAGVTLANAYGAPILLTEADKLPAETLAEIKRLKAKKVIILGGSGSVGNEVKSALQKNGMSYEIVKGSSRFATAVEIANKTKEKTKTDPTEIFFVSSDKFADALSVSAVAALKNAPIIYLPKTGDIDDVTAEYLKTMKGKIKNAYVIGGSGVISNEVVKAAGKALGLTVDKTIVRVKGSTKYDTCVAVNTKFASVLKGTAICVATGEDFPDALAGGVFAAQKSAPLFLAAGTLSDTQKSYLQTKNADSIYVFGGSKSVPDTLVQSIAKASV